jgi:hypothetical protein
MTRQPAQLTVNFSKLWQSAVARPALVLRLYGSWAMLLVQASFAYFHHAIEGIPFLALFWGLRWGTERYRVGEPRFLRTGYVLSLVLFVGLAYFSPSQVREVIKHPAAIGAAGAFAAFILLALYNDYLIIAGVVTAGKTSEPES